MVDRLSLPVLLSIAPLGQLPHEYAHMCGEHADELLVVAVEPPFLVHHFDYLRGYSNNIP